MTTVDWNKKKMNMQKCFGKLLFEDSAYYCIIKELIL